MVAACAMQGEEARPPSLARSLARSLSLALICECPTFSPLRSLVRSWFAPSSALQLRVLYADVEPLEQARLQMSTSSPGSVSGSWLHVSHHLTGKARSFVACELDGGKPACVHAIPLLVKDEAAARRRREAEVAASLSRRLRLHDEL
jgi:hypothetical protein